MLRNSAVTSAQKTKREHAYPPRSAVLCDMETQLTPVIILYARAPTHLSCFPSGRLLNFSGSIADARLPQTVRKLCKARVWAFEGPNDVI